MSTSSERTSVPVMGTSTGTRKMRTAARTTTEAPPTQTRSIPGVKIAGVFIGSSSFAGQDKATRGGCGHESPIRAIEDCRMIGDRRTVTNRLRTANSELRSEHYVAWEVVLRDGAARLLGAIDGPYGIDRDAFLTPVDTFSKSQDFTMRRVKAAHTSPAGKSSVAGVWALRRSGNMERYEIRTKSSCLRDSRRARAARPNSPHRQRERRRRGAERRRIPAHA